MVKKLIYIIGGPGTGKSTLMRRLTAGVNRVPAEPATDGFATDELFDRATGDLVGIELGTRRGTFSGTDTLSSSVITRVVPWIQAQTETGLVLGEGARLGNHRFLLTGVNSGYEVTLVALEHPQADAWRAARSIRLARTQNPAWVKSRFTAVARLADKPPAGVSAVLRGHPDDLAEAVFAATGLPGTLPRRTP
jgi:hypothetical protein